LREVSIGIEIRSARPEPSETPEADPLASKPSTARLLLVRHGQSTWNREHRIQGQLDPPLSEAGREQAGRLARRLAEHAGTPPVGFYASDLRRAFQTAQVLASSVGIAPVPTPGLREIYLGEWEGLRTDELAARFPEVWSRWTDQPDWDLVPGGEGAAAFEDRVAAAMDAIFDRHREGDVVAVTHGGVIQIALHRVVGRPSRGLFPFRIQNASLTVIERRGGRLVVSGVNDISHLDPGSVSEPGPG
jgi:2,3-bisphosphoglycerate-dependent phosphoglycerate mutase